jgi:hypothetical protein
MILRECSKKDSFPVPRQLYFVFAALLTYMSADSQMQSRLRELLGDDDQGLARYICKEAIPLSGMEYWLKTDEKNWMRKG